MTLLTPRSERLGKALAAHLLRRATFGPTKQEVDTFAQKTPAEAVALLLQQDTAPKPPMDTKTGKPWLPKRTGSNSPESILRSYVITWWFDRMCSSKLSLNERMVYFYHTHFTTIQSRANYGSALYYQLALFQRYALGNYKELATKICIDMAMLMNLDGRFNRVESPNENFAREFLELYTIGKGPQLGPDDYTNYTEHDIKEAARVFSGFQIDENFASIDPETGLPRGIMPVNDKNEAVLHDFGSKKFSSKFNNKIIQPTGNTPNAVLAEIKTFVDMVFSQKETARNICRKLYRFFVYYNITPEVENQVIEPLAGVLISNKYEIKPVVEKLLESRHFYDMAVASETAKIGGALIKSPLEIIAGMLRFYKIGLPSNQNLNEFYDVYSEIMYRMQAQDMDLYEPIDVAGYPAYHQAPNYNRNWVSSTTLAQRYKFAADLVRGIKRRDYSTEFKLDIVAYVNDRNNITDPSDAKLLVTELIDYLFPNKVSTNRFDYFLNEVLLDTLSPQAWAMEWKQYKTTGSDRGIRRQLENLVVKMMQSPEYQLF